ncbi:hypothetical protein SAMN04489727_8658 [Amycolatopsis tolypomycina]|uniref:Uncharacterized protein n=1 Tax=Amycolatopsis tolypomycina TaxID=208445 RepID=A0A1H5C9D1_9PSEU|nr:hypothetical protein [Amycolatopsis tolypomycina]SED63101.1 hypothetical protein SAMN04489727_8658 [Amycolatopsis tolypomycina]
MIDRGITLVFSPRLASALVTATGQLDLAGYGFLRDGPLRVADGPPGLIADVDGLMIGELSPTAVLPLVARRIGNWPGIPLTLVTRQGSHLRVFQCEGVDRFVASMVTSRLPNATSRSRLADGPSRRSPVPMTRWSSPARSCRTT